MTEKLKPCPGCGKSGAETPERLERMFVAHKSGLFGCVHCGIFTCTESAWNALPREPVWSSERPKVVGTYLVRFAEPEHRLIQGTWTMTADSEYLARAAVDEAPSNCEFAGPMPEPKEPK